MNWIEKYAKLLVEYSLYLKENEKVFVRSTTLSEILLKAFYKEALQAGAIVEFEISFEDQENILFTHGNEHQLKYLSPSYQESIQNFDAYLVIRAPFDSSEIFQLDETKKKLRSSAISPYDKLYFERLGSGSLKRSLCQYPTPYAAKLAGMDLESYSSFIRMHPTNCIIDIT